MKVRRWVLKKYVTGSERPTSNGGKESVVTRRIDFHLGEVLRTGSAATPLTFYFIVKSARTYLVNVLLKLLKMLGMTGLLCLVKSQKGRNTRLRAISFNDLCVSRTNQPTGKILHVRIGGRPRISLLPNATRLIAAPQW
jgi:hypothetical protein